MLKVLFSSKARVEVLKLFLLNPEQIFYQREIARQTHLPIRAVQREVSRLGKIGLLEESISGNRVYYKTNKNCPIYPELKSIILKTTGIGLLLKERLAKDRKDMALAFIYGSYARNTENIDSDIDLMIVGDITSRRVSTLLSPAKNELRREINFVVYSEKEFKRRIVKKDHFISGVVKSPKIFLKGNINVLKRFTK